MSLVVVVGVGFSDVGVVLGVASGGRRVVDGVVVAGSFSGSTDVLAKEAMLDKSQANSVSITLSVCDVRAGCFPDCDG